jgi:hypothetical protein
MSNLLSSMVSMGKAAMQRLQAPVDPTAVVSVSHSDLAAVHAVDREDCLVLYGPRKVAKIPEDIYEVVVHTEKAKMSFR